MANVGLIACVSGKRTSPTEARELYDSPLFRKAQRYIETHCNRWYILSAKYGLVDPDQIIKPYEETLNGKSRADCERWAKGVWASLCGHLAPGDEVIILAGKLYRDFLVDKLIQYGCSVSIPMEGLGIGKQLHWLSEQNAVSSRGRDLERLYRGLRALELGLGGRRIMAECTGRQGWPKRGVYLFFEPGEQRLDGKECRVVRVGTHGVSRGSKTTLWNRLRTHRGTGGYSGNHRGSIFRLHVGAALSARDPRLALPSWGTRRAAGAEVRRSENPLELQVSGYIGRMSILWLSVEDAAGPSSDRAYIERNLIGMLVGTLGPADPPSPDWLGLFSPSELIRTSGLWNLNFLNYCYQPEFLDVLEEYVQITLGRASPPLGSIAPAGWYARER